MSDSEKLLICSIIGLLAMVGFVTVFAELGVRVERWSRRVYTRVRDFNLEHWLHTCDPKLGVFRLWIDRRMRASGDPFFRDGQLIRYLDGRIVPVRAVLRSPHAIGYGDLSKGIDWRGRRLPIMTINPKMAEDMISGDRVASGIEFDGGPGFMTGAEDMPNAHEYEDDYDDEGLDSYLAELRVADADRKKEPQIATADWAERPDLQDALQAGGVSTPLSGNKGKLDVTLDKVKVILQDAIDAGTIKKSEFEAALQKKGPDAVPAHFDESVYQTMSVPQIVTRMNKILDDLADDPTDLEEEATKKKPATKRTPRKDRPRIPTSTRRSPNKKKDRGRKAR